jgi:hypothetical protein
MVNTTSTKSDKKRQPPSFTTREVSEKNPSGDFSRLRLRVLLLEVKLGVCLKLIFLK